LKENIGVLIIEDSILMVSAISDMLLSDPRIKILGYARNGKEGIEKVSSLNPDVVTLDMEMPVMNGIEFLKSIMNVHPVPIVMLSAYTKRGARETIEALNLGAVDFVSKPSGSISLNMHTVKKELIDKIVLAAKIKEKNLLKSHRAKAQLLRYIPSKNETKIIILCSSTGGPKALNVIISSLPGNLNACILIVQHMPGEFTPMLAERLDKTSALHVTEAKGGEPILSGKVYVAPGGKHLEISKEEKVVLSNKPKRHSVRPSCDITLKSLASFGNRMLAVVLTGMGKDGSEGLSELKKKNGRVIVEDASTSVIFGMPKAAIETGFVDKVIPLTEIAQEIIEFAR